MTLPQAIKAADSEAVDRSLLASLPRSVASTITERRLDCSTLEYGYDTAFADYVLGRGALPGEIATALAMVEATLQSCPADVVKRELLRLKLTTKTRAQDAADLSFQLAVYAEELAAYPEDAVIDALRYWRAREKWWPAWAELKALLDDRVKRRLSLERVLRAELRNAA
jgi:hypothetical protein